MHMDVAANGDEAVCSILVVDGYRHAPTAEPREAVATIGSSVSP
ncbi:hypothetical protein [Microbacterium rhizomatis]|nr:hypothetical protein [Microbacterium rhizomatis]